MTWIANDLSLVARILFWVSPNERVALGRFLASIELREGESCWFWTAETTSSGYGRFYSRGVRTMAHRWLYERLVGAIPDGLVLDHLCRTRNCVNPEHLEPVTNAENVRRGLNFAGARGTCPSGHTYSEQNTRWYKGRRYCRACNQGGGEGRLTRGSRGGSLLSSNALRAKAVVA